MSGETGAILVYDPLKRSPPEPHPRPRVIGETRGITYRSKLCAQGAGAPVTRQGPPHRTKPQSFMMNVTAQEIRLILDELERMRNHKESRMS